MIRKWGGVMHSKVATSLILSNQLRAENDMGNLMKCDTNINIQHC